MTCPIRQGEYVAQRLTPETQSLVSEWSALHGQPVDSWPPVGCIVYRGQVPVIACFLLSTDGKVAFLTSVIGDPRIEKGIRRASIPIMVDWISREAKSRGFTALISTPTVDSLTAAMLQTGFEIYPRKADYLIKGL